MGRRERVRVGGYNRFLLATTVLASTPPILSYCQSLHSLTVLSNTLLCERCSLLLAATLTACQRLLQVWPCSEEWQGSSYSGKVQTATQTDRQRKKGENHIYGDRNMRHQAENQTQTSNIFLFIKIYSLNSCSQRTSSLQRHHSGQQTGCPPNTDSSPGNVLLNRDAHKQTSWGKTVYVKRDTVARKTTHTRFHHTVFNEQ